MSTRTMDEGEQEVLWESWQNAMVEIERLREELSQAHIGCTTEQEGDDLRAEVNGLRGVLLDLRNRSLLWRDTEFGREVARVIAEIDPWVTKPQPKGDEHAVAETNWKNDALNAESLLRRMREGKGVPLFNAEIDRVLAREEDVAI